MSNIVGIFCIGPNPAACLVQNGKLVAMAEEERFRRTKDIELVLPTKAMHYCLLEGKIGIEDIDTIAYAWDTRAYKGSILFNKLIKWLMYNRASDLQGSAFDEIYARSLYALTEVEFHNPSFIRQMFRNHWDTISYNLPIPKIRFIPHHYCHAAATFFTSDFEQASILTIDRNGEENCTVLWQGNGSNIKPIETYELPNSLGWFYAGFTDYLGFRPEYHEGKVMGLAAYGKPNPDLTAKINKILSIHENGSYEVDPTYFYYGTGYGYAYKKKLVELLGKPPRRDEGDIDPFYQDVAYALQERLEEVLLCLTKRLVIKTHMPNLCLAGGVSLNCVANGKLKQSGIIERIHVPPPNNDAGAALGAALIVACEEGLNPRFIMEHANWGPGFSDNQICRDLDQLGIQYQNNENIERVIAQDIANGLSIGWFQDRMEIGPRALGARSILGDARNPNMHSKLNKIKGREPWRPLAPAILEEAMGDYFDNICSSPFMTVAYMVKADKQKTIPAVVHVDGTSRPQTVTNKNAPERYWKLLKYFYELTGVPVIINTSFNTKDEPIVCTIKDAIKTFYASELDVLAIGSSIIRK